TLVAGLVIVVCAVASRTPAARRVVAMVAFVASLGVVCVAAFNLLHIREVEVGGERVDLGQLGFDVTFGVGLWTTLVAGFGAAVSGALLLAGVAWTAGRPEDG
ncbi:MAG: hypothetical protein R2695_21895, partial [Acidimicrobiales bacterium]